MVEWDIIKKLMKAFPRSFIIATGEGEAEFIAHREANSYFRLIDCYTEFDVKCKVLEWLSRDAHKTAPFDSNRKNNEFNKFILNGINSYLGTNFTEDDMDIIYTYLGNRCNHEKTVKFINSGYDMSILKGGEG
jgi:hypothetical protein